MVRSVTGRLVERSQPHLARVNGQQITVIVLEAEHQRPSESQMHTHVEVVQRHVARYVQQAIVATEAQLQRDLHASYKSPWYSLRYFSLG